MQETIGKTDKRYFGGLVGMSVLGVVGFIIFPPVGAIPGGLLGFGIGNVLGRKFKRQKRQKDGLNQFSQYELRLECILELINQKIKQNLDIKHFELYLEKAVREFRPALILQLNEPKFKTLLNRFARVLKRNAAHTALLNSTAQTFYIIEERTFPTIAVTRLRSFFIPLIGILKGYYKDTNNQLEVITKIEELLQMPYSSELLAKPEYSQEKMVDHLFQNLPLCFASKSEYLMSAKTLIDLEYFYLQKSGLDIFDLEIQKRSDKGKLFRRSNSLPFEESENYLWKYKQKDQLKDFALDLICRSNLRTQQKVEPRQYQQAHSRNQSMQNVDMMANYSDSYYQNKFEKRKSFRPSVISDANKELDQDDDSPSRLKAQLDGFESPTLFKMQPPALFKGDIRDLESDDESGDDQPNQDQSVEYEQPNQHHYMNDSYMEDIKEENKHESPNVSVHNIEIKVHPFIHYFDELLNIEKEPLTDSIWKQTVNKPDTKVYQKKIKDSPICMVKAFCIIPYSVEQIYMSIWDVSIRTTWDQLFQEFRITQSFDQYELLYYMIKTPFGITKRDWLQKRIMIRDYPNPGDLMMHFISVEHPSMPPRKGVIRAETIVSGYVIRPIGPTSSSITIISQNDVKGLIPSSIVNRVAAKAPVDWVNNMMKGCKIAKDRGIP